MITGDGGEGEGRLQQVFSSRAGNEAGGVVVDVDEQRER